VENLRNYVSTFDPEKMIYFGSLHKKDLPTGYITGSAIVFSRKVMQVIVNDIIPNENTLCRTGIKMGDDVAIAICLAKKNITATDTRDSDGSQRFIPIRPESMAKGNAEGYLKKISGGDHFHSGIAAFSERSITFHYLTPFEFRWLDFLIYRLKVPRLTEIF